MKKSELIELCYHYLLKQHNIATNSIRRRYAMSSKKGDSVPLAVIPPQDEPLVSRTSIGIEAGNVSIKKIARMLEFFEMVWWVPDPPIDPEEVISKLSNFGLDPSFYKGFIELPKQTNDQYQGLHILTFSRLQGKPHIFDPDTKVSVALPGFKSLPEKLGMLTPTAVLAHTLCEDTTDEEDPNFICKRCGNCCKTNYMIDIITRTEWERIIAFLNEDSNTSIEVVDFDEGKVQTFDLDSMEVFKPTDENERFSDFVWAMDDAIKCPFLELNEETCEYSCSVYEVRPQSCRNHKCEKAPHEDINSKFGKQEYPDVCLKCFEEHTEFLEEEAGEEGEEGKRDEPPTCELEECKCPQGQYELRRAYQTLWCKLNPDQYDFESAIKKERKYLVNGLALDKKDDFIMENDLGATTGPIKFLNLLDKEVFDLLYFTQNY